MLKNGNIVYCCRHGWWIRTLLCATPACCSKLLLSLPTKKEKWKTWVHFLQCIKWPTTDLFPIPNIFVTKCNHNVNRWRWLCPNAESKQQHLMNCISILTSSEIVLDFLFDRFSVWMVWMLNERAQPGMIKRKWMNEFSVHTAQVSLWILNTPFVCLNELMILSCRLHSFHFVVDSSRLPRSFPSMFCVRCMKCAASFEITFVPNGPYDRTNYLV